MTKAEIGLFVQEERKKQGLSQKALSANAGISRYQQIIEIEKAQFDYGIGNLIKVLDALGFDLTFVQPGQSVQTTGPVIIGDVLHIPANSFDFSKVEAAKEEEPEKPKTFPGTKNAPTPFKRKNNL